MRVDEELMEHLKKEDGSAYQLICDQKEPRMSKAEFLVSFLEGKNASVIDVGCCGHKQNIDKQIISRTWLHGLLDEVTVRNVGIDLNNEAVSYLKSRHGRSDIFCYNIMCDEPKIKSVIGNERYDYVILADVLEHTFDPIGFLKKLRGGGYADYIIITVPNAFHFVNMWVAWKRNGESINSDHKFWFTPFTLMKCMLYAGITPMEFGCCDFKLRGIQVPRFILKDIMGATVYCIGKF